jgi:hypothetical protein
MDGLSPVFEVHGRNGRLVQGRSDWDTAPAIRA